MSKFLKKAFEDMKQSAAEQREVSKAVFEATRAESRAQFEENRFANSLRRAKAQSRAQWEKAKELHDPAKRKAEQHTVNQEKIAAAEARTAQAEARIKEAQSERGEQQ